MTTGEESTGIEQLQMEVRELRQAMNVATLTFTQLQEELVRMRVNLARQESMQRLQWAIDHYTMSDMFLELTFEDFPRITRVEVILQHFRMGRSIVFNDNICMGYNVLPEPDKARVHAAVRNVLCYLLGVSPRWELNNDDGEDVLHYEI